MKLMRRNPQIFRAFLIAFTALILGITGCSSTGNSLGQKWSDHQVKGQITKGFAKDPVFKYRDVQTDVREGNVQLSGYVESAEQRQRAAEIASSAKGAKQVINHIMIKPTATGPATIRDPFGQDPGRLLLDTNSAPVHLRNLPSSSTNSIH